jgi:hypothetical protein
LNRQERRGNYRSVNSQPPPPPPAPVPPQQIQLPRQGIGCFGMGCLTVLIAGFILLAGMIGCTWFFYVKMVDRLTSPAGVDVKIEPPSESQFQAAEKSMARLKKAAANNEETTVEFTAADLNALLARDLDFTEWRGRTRIEIADSAMTLTVSAPLNSIPLRKFKSRWFNGTVRFSFTYESGIFSFDIKSAEAGGYQVPDIFLSSSSISYLDEGLNAGFRGELDNDDRDSEFWNPEFWNHVKTMSLKGDKLAVTTQRD